MELGAFSVSLSVKDIHVSKAFYEKLGFTVFGGDITPFVSKDVCDDVIARVQENGQLGDY